MINRIINESSKRITCGYLEYNNHLGIDLGWMKYKIMFMLILKE